MKGLKILGLVVLGVIALLFIVGLFLPSEYATERSVEINASPETVFGLVNDLTYWKDWGPWQAEDPDMTVSYGDVTQGEGASYSWVSEKMGSGSLTILESVEYSSITTELDFGERGIANGHWTFEETGDGVTVTWGITGNSGNNVIMKYFGVMMDMMVGPAFERGLANIKEIAESLPEPDPVMEGEEMTSQ